MTTYSKAISESHSTTDSPVAVKGSPTPWTANPNTINTVPLGQASSTVAFDFSPQGSEYIFSVFGDVLLEGPTYQTNTPITFTATTELPHYRTILEYRWDFGDGIVGWGNPVEHIYVVPNEHIRVILKATDDQGRQYVIAKQIYFQIVQTFDLTVGITGTGTGVITSDPAGISCPGTCTGTYSDVALTVVPDAGMAFHGWSTGDTSTTTVVILDSDLTVTAEIDPLTSPSTTLYPKTTLYPD